MRRCETKAGAVMSSQGREIQVNSVIEIGNLTELAKPIQNEAIEVIIEVDMTLIDPKMIRIEPVQIQTDIGLMNVVDQHHQTPTVKRPGPNWTEKEANPTELKVNGAIQIELEVILIERRVIQIGPKVKSVGTEPNQNGRELRRMTPIEQEVIPTELNVIQIE